MKGPHGYFPSGISLKNHYNEFGTNHFAIPTILTIASCRKIDFFAEVTGYSNIYCESCLKAGVKNRICT